jgi:hypothetical protein
MNLASTDYSRPKTALPLGIKTGPNESYYGGFFNT